MPQPLARAVSSPRPALLLSLVAAPLAALPGCVGPGAADRGAPVADSASFEVTTDGNIEEWPADVAATADETYAYFRVRIAGEPYTLQAARETTALWIDTDNNPATGMPAYFGPAAAGVPAKLGVDLEIQFSPFDKAKSATRSGAALFRVGRDGSRVSVPREFAEDLHFAPTYAAPWYEVRLSRRVAEFGKSFAGAAVLLSASGAIEGYSEPFASAAPAAGPQRSLASAELPTCPPGAVRVMTFNVLKNKPLEDAGRFKSILAALKPDIILVEEWDAGEEKLRGWFTAHVPGEWNVVGGDAGVAIVSRFPLEKLPAEPTTPDENGKPRPVRLIAAAASTPGGKVLAAAMHLKCCGSSGSSEDNRRLAEARAANQALSSLIGAGDYSLLAIGGDLNLVGTRPPLDLLRAGLDSGSDLEIAPARVLGDRTYYTWSEPRNAFAPGRLDFLLTGPGGARVAEAFVLDTTRLDEASLARMGLAAADSGASDHLPVVADVFPR